jgi:uncharacterized protein (TIGR02996 family)
MHDRQALARAVAASPADDAPRLIYADWLDEHGEADHAEFIRLQVRPPAGCDGTGPAGRCPCRACGPGRKRVRDLIITRLPDWVGPAWDDLQGFELRRGFLRWVSMDPVPFTALAHAVFAEQPVEAVELARC